VTAALYVFCGLPGCGKTTQSKRLAAHFGATYLRIDTIDDGLQASALAPFDVMDGAYAVARALASDALALDQCVVADAVHWTTATVTPWASVAAAADVACHWIEVTCAKPELDARLEARRAGGWKVGEDWDAIVARTMDPIANPTVRLDTTGGDIEATFTHLIAKLTQLHALP